MISIAPVDRPDLWKGAVAWTQADGLTQPWRLTPAETRFAYAPVLLERARMPAGVRMEARTSATSLTVDLVAEQESTLDLCVDSDLVTRTDIRVGANPLSFELPPGDHDVTVWLPQGAEIRIANAAVDASATTRQRPQRRWVTYGSSITMCRTAPGPTETWPAIVAQTRDWDLTCLGFGGQCHLDPVVGRTIDSLEADLISVCLGINVYGHGSFSTRTWAGQVCEFLRRLRTGHPQADLVVLTPISSPDREDTASASGLTLGQIRNEVAQVTRDLATDDGRLHLIDGLDVLGHDEAEGLLADRLHPSPAGYHLMGERIGMLLDRLPLGDHPGR